MKSIRRELMIWILGGTTLLLIVSGLFLAALIRHRLLTDYDHTLESKTRVFATLICTEGEGMEVEFAGEYMPEFEAPVNPEYFQFRQVNGALIERSDSLGNQDLPFESGKISKTVFGNLPLPDGRAGRFVQISVIPRIEDEIELTPSPPPLATGPVGKPVVLTVARSREELDQELCAVYLAIGGTHSLLLLLIGLLVWRSIRRGFRPIGALDTQIRQYTPDALDFQIDLPDIPVEIQSIPGAINGLLEKVRASIARERRFSGDVAHELRTPISELRVACEIGTKWPDDPEQTGRRFADALEATLHLEQIVVNLIELTRCESGRALLRPVRIEVYPMLGQCWTQTATKAEEKNVRLDNRIDPEFVLYTDRDKFEMILQNLIRNAVTYSPIGAEIICTSCAGENGAVLRLQNPTEGLQPEDLPHLFERFWRKEHLDGDGGHHSGLGLPIVKALADVLHIDVQVTLERNNQLFTVQLSFPPGGERE